MKVCHILPPKVIPYVSDILGTQHLLLPALMRYDTYRQFYIRDSVGGWLTLDNGVAEGRMVSFGHVLAMARAANVQEVVLPDVMCNMDLTLELLSQTFYEAFIRRFDFKFMFVPQGETIKEVIHCAEQAINMCPVLIHSFGIPRHILSVAPSARAQIAAELRDQFPRREIHLLGTHPDEVSELRYYGYDYRDVGVRSVDTSLAWNATLESVPLNGSRSLSYNLSIKRQPIDEFATATFENGFEAAQEKLLRDNMEAINSWV
jgi:hypothetical protein